MGKQYLISIITMFFLSSCLTSDWLNQKTDKNLAIPSTSNDFQAILDNALIMNISTPGLAEVGSDGHYILPSLWQQSYYPDNERNAYTWSHKFPGLKVADWNSSYQKVYYANVVIEGLSKNSPEDQRAALNWDNLKGQALFFRAKTFYELSQIYAPQYDPSTASSDLGIPLRLNSDPNIKSFRSSVKDTYDRIINDLIEAKSLLPNIQALKTRPSRAATFALLARIYLSMNDFENAYLNADSCLQLYNTLIDFNTLNQNSSLPLGPSKNAPNAETIFYGATVFCFSNPGFSGARVDSVFFSSYGNNDLRRAIFFTISSDNTVNFKGMYTNQTTAQFSGLATDEIYLIRSECLARKGNASAAMADLNSLLQKRWKSGPPFIPLVASTADDALNQILKERQKELFMRCLRWSDLRRLNKDPRFAITLSRTIGGSTYTLPPNDYRYTLPIPDDIIQQTQIQQNPGW